jgi:hypothetical protein
MRWEARNPRGRRSLADEKNERLHQAQPDGPMAHIACASEREPGKTISIADPAIRPGGIRFLGFDSLVGFPLIMR